MTRILKILTLTLALALFAGLTALMGSTPRPNLDLSGLELTAVLVAGSCLGMLVIRSVRR